MTDSRYRPAIEKVCFISLTLSLLTVIAAYILLAEINLPSTNPVYLFVRATNSWCWLLTFMGFAAHHLDFSNGFLKYANEAVLPFYILHQIVIVSVGYFIRNWQLEIFPKYLFLAATSFAIIMALYEFTVRLFNVLRYLFGMKE